MSHVRLSEAATTTIATFLNVMSCTLIVTNIPEEYTAAIVMENCEGHFSSFKSKKKLELE